MSRPSIIAIDGPAASGKTTLARRIADILGYLYFDTGLMYRAVTLIALERGLDISDEPAMSDLAAGLLIDVQRSPGIDRKPSFIYVNGRDVSAHLRTAEVDANVSAVSAIKGVREALTRQQRRVGERGHVVVVGRDIGTVVFPQADLKLYLDASVEERARRRWKDFQNQGHDEAYQNVLEAMRERDRKDSARAVAPLMPASDAILIDTTNVELADLIEQVMSLISDMNEEETPAQEGNKDGA